MKRLLLVGGGHAHLEVLRRLGRARPAGVETVLASPHRHSVYSGMVPGLIAGDYPPEECRIDLDPLARRAGARRIEARAVSFDADARRLVLEDGAAIEADLVSFDIGSVPAAADIAGAHRAFALRPIERFVTMLPELCESVHAGRVRDVVVVGAGAAGVETALALSRRLRAGLPARFAADLRVVLAGDAEEPLPAFPPRARARVMAALKSRGVRLVLGRAVTAIDAEGLVFEGDVRLDAQVVILSGGAAAAPWLAASGLAQDRQGFIAVDACLRSVSHPAVFAAGDCATPVDASIGFPVPKSGVYAVREGPVLAHNLQRVLEGAAPRPWRPQRQSLVILNTGDRSGIALRGGWCAGGAWVWRWKDWLDRRFMRRYRETAG